MSDIPASGIAASFEEIIGWPYKSPGTNDKNGIDCSGAWVRAFQQYGKSIYHGSNTIYRQYCGEKGPLASAVQLKVGMAVFKHRNDGREPAQYRGDGIGNMYHIGAVTSLSPLRIVHATTPVAKVDTSAGAWTHYAKVNEVAYAYTPPPTVIGRLQVTTRQGSLNLRDHPSESGRILTTMPKDTIVDQLSAEQNGFYQVYYLGMVGYASAQYLTPIAPTAGWGVWIACSDQNSAQNLANALRGAQAVQRIS